MRLYIVRHGETAWNRERRLQGHSDVPLNEQGLALASLTGKALSGIPFDLCIAGPLMRPRQTALCILKENQRFCALQKDAETLAIDAFCPLGEGAAAGIGEAVSDPGAFPLFTDARITEVSFGSWEGLSCAPDRMEIPVSNFGDFFRDPALVQFPADAETMGAVKERTAAFLRTLCETPAFTDKTILVATHGYALRAMLNPFYAHPEDFWQGKTPLNCSVSVLETGENGKLRLSVKDRIYYDPALAASYTDPKKD